jgi:AAHS family 4-hydroxybenzoate transporter-like MFS transporter
MIVALTSSYGGLLAARFAVGIGTGGLLPVCWALNIEYAPKRFRASVVTLVMLGYSAGVSLGGPAVLWLEPNYGWQSVFIMGGALSLAATVALVALLPESLRFLTAQARDRAAIRRILHRLAPALALPEDARFVLGDEKDEPRRFHPALLFHGELRWITPMLWLATIFSAMATFFLSTWTPLVFHSLNFPPAEAAAAGSIAAISGAVGGLTLMRFTDHYGAVAIAAMPLLAIPLLLTGGLVDIGGDGLLVLVGMIAFALIGGHLGMNSIAGMFYPSALRASGAGWATAIGKIGSILGPLLAGVVLSTSLPTRCVFAVAAVCPVLMLMSLLTIWRVQRGSGDRN